MILSDKTIKEIILDNKVYLVSPFNPDNLQPCSIDLCLGDELKTIHGKCIDLSQDSYKLKPNEFILGSTLERVNVPYDLMGRVEGKSSIARLGVTIHITAGFIDAGFNGNVTLEIYNCSDKEFELYHGMNICQIVFETLSSRVDRPYGCKELNSHYQNSEGTVLSKYEGLDG